MSAIPTSVTEEQFDQYIRPYPKTAKRGYECKIALYKVFNYILKRLHSGCQWSQVPIAAVPANSEKKNSLGKPFTIAGRNGMLPVVLNEFGSKVSV